MKRLLISTTSLFTLFVAANAVAQEAPTPDVAGKAATNVDEIVVTATRTPQTLDRIGSSITVITQQEIQDRQTVVLSDLLASTPGVSFSRTGGVGGTTSLRIRGAETDQTIVVIDGVKLNDPASTGGGYNSANLFVGDVERVEVLRGAQSTLWGSQAIGGVVNIVTTVPKKEFEASASAEGGSLGTGYGKVALGGADGRLTWRLAGDYYTTDGISSFANGTERDGYHHSGVSGRFGYEFSDDFSVDLRGVYSRGRNEFDGFPAPLFAFADTPEYGTTKELVGYAGVNFGMLDGRLKNRLAFGYTDTDRDNYNPSQAVTPVTFDAAGKNKRIEYQGSFAIIPGWDAVFGAEHESSSFRTASPSAFTPNPTPSTAKVGINSGYVQIQAELVKGLTLTGGLRDDSHDTFGNRVLGQAAAAWSLNDGSTIVRASFGQGFKAPTLYQLYSVYGNTALRPEESNSFDGGIEQHFLDHTLKFSATGFYRKSENQIDFVSCPGVNPLCTPGKPGVYDNIAQTRAQGIELEGSVVIEAFKIKANYTYTDTDNVSPGNANFGKELARRPKHQANVSASYEWPMDITTGVDLHYVGNTYDTAANTFVLPAHTLIDVRVAWQFNEMVEVYGRAENLTDEIYQTTRNYGTLPRTFIGGVRVKY